MHFKGSERPVEKRISVGSLGGGGGKLNQFSPATHPPVVQIQLGTPNRQVPSILRRVAYKLQKNLLDDLKCRRPFPYLLVLQPSLVHSVNLSRNRHLFSQESIGSGRNFRPNQYNKQRGYFSFGTPWLLATIEHVEGVTNDSLANDKKHLNSFSTKQISLDSRDPFNGVSGKATNISQTNGSPTITLPLHQGRRIWRKRG